MSMHSWTMTFLRQKIVLEPWRDLDSSYISNNSITECRNIVVMPKGYLAPRTQENLAELYKYVKRHFKKSNYNDKRTRAYRWMKMHDSEFGR